MASHTSVPYPPPLPEARTDYKILAGEDADERRMSFSILSIPNPTHFMISSRFALQVKENLLFYGPSWKPTFQVLKRFICGRNALQSLKRGVFTCGGKKRGNNLGSITGNLVCSTQVAFVCRRDYPTHSDDRDDITLQTKCGEISR